VSHNKKGWKVKLKKVEEKTGEKNE